ncbi:MAG TPA: hypothetical protein VGK59_21200 [Ohtaekwangia sp.]
MSLKKIISSAILGTTFMTAWSIIVSRKTQKQFREPVLLNLLLRRMAYKNKVDADSAAGWISHYLAGAAFTAVYDQVWQKQKPSLRNSLVLGGISGLAGIGIWEMAFQMHPNPPHVDRKNYYQQLLIAHLIFGLFAALGYRLDEIRNSEQVKAIIRKVKKEGSLLQA